MSEIPQTWETISFGELNEFVSSSIDPVTLPDELFTLYSVPSYPQQIPERILGRSIGSTKQLVRHDDVLVCKINPRINRVWRVFDTWYETQIASSEWIVMRSHKCIAKYLQYYFKSPGFRGMICADVTGVGGSLTRAQPRRVSSFPVPIPPAAEQKRIADKLDSLLSRVDSCRERLDRVPQILKRFRQSVLTAALNGTLTKEWRELKGTKHHWRTQRANDVCTRVQSGTTPKSDEFRSETGIPFLKVYNIVDQRVDFAYRSQFVDEDVFRNRMQRASVLPNDVLMNIVGPPLGKVAIVPESFPEWAINQAIAMFRAGPALDPRFLYYQLCSGLPYSQLLLETRGSAGQANISLTQCREMLLSVPPLEEQIEIVHRIEVLFAFVERLEALLDKSRGKVEGLTSAILAKAFRGELVPQDPNDEPARLLLDRIRSQRKTFSTINPKETTKRTPRTPRKKAAMTKSRFDDDVQGKPYLAGFLKGSNRSQSAEDLFKQADLPLVDFYKQLDFEVKQKLIIDRDGQLEAA